MFDQLVTALQDAGLNIPDEVTDYGGLCIAIKANPHRGDSDRDDLDDDLPTQAGSPGVMEMSRGVPRRRRGRSLSDGRGTRPAQQSVTEFMCAAVDPKTGK